ncbi:alpha/beta hydrolase fold protein [Byssothecium circinans]|uniref:Alpha/beta hydrolase fold protein n=1 Tax=Byssothecium circinans TaxID=147558 RepID=A0A6A5UL42_9PLEO|nr:alpha/beta hydrolase fold protein [Byssothecium circinans]
MSHTRTKLSPLERFDLIFSILKTISAAIATLLVVPFRGSSGHPKPLKHVIHTALRVMNARASAKQIQNMNASTSEVYEAFAKAKGFKPTSTHLIEDATAHWIGSPDAERILIVFHGGGFVYPATTQFQFVYDVQKEAGDDTAGIVLSYSLAPGKPYPHQLKQAVALMSHLINEAGKKPENIILVGDSAGANLILGVISHLLHPHPDPSIPPLHMDTPLKGALLVSPWTNFNPAAASYTTNRKKDFVNRYILAKWGRYYMGTASSDAYNQPGTATDKWWQGIDAKVRDVAITAGGNEVMFDDTRTFSETLKKSFPGLEVQIMKEETHDQIFMDPVVGEKVASDSAKLIKSWVMARL